MQVIRFQAKTVVAVARACVQPADKSVVLCEQDRLYVSSLALNFWLLIGFVP
jgi:hypothetical protein